MHLKYILARTRISKRCCGTICTVVVFGGSNRCECFIHFLLSPISPVWLDSSYHARAATTRSICNFQTCLRNLFRASRERCCAQTELPAARKLPKRHGHLEWLSCQLPLRVNRAEWLHPQGLPVFSCRVPVYVWGACRLVGCLSTCGVHVYL